MFANHPLMDEQRPSPHNFQSLRLCLNVRHSKALLLSHRVKYLLVKIFSGKKRTNSKSRCSKFGRTGDYKKLELKISRLKQPLGYIIIISSLSGDMFLPKWVCNTHHYASERGKLVDYRSPFSTALGGNTWRLKIYRSVMNKIKLLNTF